MKRKVALVTAMMFCCMTFSPAMAVESTPSVEQVQLAYMDLETVDESMQSRILEARNEIIFSESWAADGVTAYVKDTDGTVIEKLPEFSELFPSDWEIPYFASTNKESKTEVAMRATTDITFEDEVYLDRPDSGTMSDPFVVRATHGFEGTAAEYFITEFSTSGFMSGAEEYNIGYSNDDTGKTLAWKAHMAPGKSLVLSNPPKDTDVAIRASTYTSPGDWWMTVLTELA